MSNSDSILVTSSRDNDLMSESSDSVSSERGGSHGGCSWCEGGFARGGGRE